MKTKRSTEYIQRTSYSSWYIIPTQLIVANDDNHHKWCHNWKHCAKSSFSYFDGYPRVVALTSLELAIQSRLTCNLCPSSCSTFLLPRIQGYGTVSGQLFFLHSLHWFGQTIQSQRWQRQRDTLALAMFSYFCPSAKPRSLWFLSLEIWLRWLIWYPVFTSAFWWFCL